MDDDIDFLIDEDETPPPQNNNTSAATATTNTTTTTATTTNETAASVATAFSFLHESKNLQPDNDNEDCFAALIGEEDEEEEEEKVDEANRKKQQQQQQEDLFYSGDQEDDEDDEETDDDETDDEEDNAAASSGSSSSRVDFSETELRSLIARVISAKEKFQKFSPTLCGHPFIWINLNEGHNNSSNSNTNVNATPIIVPGVAKLRHRIDAELRLLTNILAEGNYKKAKCNNVMWLEMIVQVLQVEKDILFVSVTLPLRAKKKEQKVTGLDFDVVSNGGKRWIKCRGSRRNLELDVVFEDGEEEEEEDEDHDQITETTTTTTTTTTNNNDTSATTNSTSNEKKKKKVVLPPFLELLSRISQTKYTTPLRLPFQQLPEIILSCNIPPTKRALHVVAKAAPNVNVITHSSLSSSCLPSFVEYEIKGVCFDVTAMVALCSDVCNGSADFSTFPSNPVLARQAQSEREGQRCIENFLAPTLKKFTITDLSQVDDKLKKVLGERGDIVASRREGHQEFWNSSSSAALKEDEEELAPLILEKDPNAFFDVTSSSSNNNNDDNNNSASATSSSSSRTTTSSVTTMPQNWIAPIAAISEFCWIVETISGKQEKARAIWLLRRLYSVDTDKHKLTSHLEKVFAGNNSIKARQLNVFSCGDSTHSVTLSANKSFLHSAFESGQLLLCAHHPARAFTERKRINADANSSNKELKK